MYNKSMPNKEEVKNYLEGNHLDSWHGGIYSQSMNERIAKIEATHLHMQGTLSELKSETSSLRLWILGCSISTFLGIAAIVIAFGAYQASWFQQSLDRNWEIGLKTMDKIDSTMLRMERLDAEQKAGKALPTQLQSQ